MRPALIAFNEHQVEGKMKSTWAQACIFDLILQTMVLLVIFYGFGDEWEGMALPHSFVKLLGVSVFIGFIALRTQIIVKAHQRIEKAIKKPATIDD